MRKSRKIILVVMLAISSGGRSVTRLDGSKFPIVWTEPNDMIRDYVIGRSVIHSATRPTTTQATTQP